MPRKMVMDEEALLTRCERLLKSLSYAEVKSERVAEYANALYGVTEAELEQAIAMALRKCEKGFPPQPGEIWAQVETLRDGATGRTGTLKEMKSWGSMTEEERLSCIQDQEWQAIKEKVKPEPRVYEAGNSFEPQRLFLSEQQEALKQMYMRQDLQDGLPRTKWEIMAIKAEQNVQRHGRSCLPSERSRRQRT